MKKSTDIQEKLIEAATELIRSSNGNIHEISTRAIAEKANTNAALINYHFQTKQHLVEICIHRIISGVVSSFKPDPEETDSIKRLRKTVKSVADFLCSNEAISRISILGDMNEPRIHDNSTNTARGLMRGLADSELPDKQKAMLAFMLTSVVQCAFLKKNLFGELFQLDFLQKPDRDDFLDFMMDRFFAEGGEGQ